MGFAGTHISGIGVSCDDLETLIEQGEELSPNWREYVREFDYPQENGWYYFERDGETGLNTPVPVIRNERPKASVGYRSMKVLHNTMFEKSGMLFAPMQSIAKAVDGSCFETAFTRFENVVKGITSDCLQCGDCAMPIRRIYVHKASARRTRGTALVAEVAMGGARSSQTKKNVSTCGRMSESRLRSQPSRQLITN